MLSKNLLKLCIDGFLKLTTRTNHNQSVSTLLYLKAGKEYLQCVHWEEA